jgi:hypothetical protein
MRSLLWLLLVVASVAVPVAAPVAFASDDWCDTDPILLIQTPAGRLVPLYVTVGAHNILFTPDTLLGSLLLSYSVAPASNGAATSVSVVVTVPPSLLDPSFATRATVSTGALGAGTVYARAVGTSGIPTALTFKLPYG